MSASSREIKTQTTIPRSAYSVSKFFKQKACEVAVSPISTFDSIDDAHQFLIVATLAIRYLLLETSLTPDPIGIIMQYLTFESGPKRRIYYTSAGQKTGHLHPHSVPVIQYGDLPERKESKTTLSPQAHHQSPEATRFGIALTTKKSDTASISRTQLSREAWPCSNPYEEKIVAAMRDIWQLLESKAIQFYFSKEEEHLQFLENVQKREITLSLSHEVELLIQKIIILKNILPDAMRQGIRQMKQAFVENADVLLKKFSISPNAKFDALLQHLLEKMTLRKYESSILESTAYLVTPEDCILLHLKGTKTICGGNVMDNFPYLSDEKENELILNRILADFKSEPNNLKQLAEVYAICDQNDLSIGNTIRNRFAKLVTCRNHLAELIVRLPANRELVKNVLELYKDIIVEATAKDQVRATKTGYSELLQFCVYQQPHSCVTRPIIQFAIEIMNSSTKRLDHFASMCSELIYILTSPGSPAERFEKIKLYLVKEYLLIRMDVSYHNGKGSRLGNAIQTVLLQEFELQFDKVFHQPISLREKEEKVNSSELSRLQSKVAKLYRMAGRYCLRVAVPRPVHKPDRDIFSNIVEEVLAIICCCLRKKTYKIMNYPPIALDFRIAECRQLLREYQIYVPQVIASDCRLMTLDEFKPQAPGARNKKGA